jgi:hypothetical protein
MQLRRLLEGEHNGRVLLDLLAERIAKEALSGKHAFIKEVLDRLDGPVNQKHDVVVEKRSAIEVLASMDEDEKLAIIHRARLGHMLPHPRPAKEAIHGTWNPGGRPKGKSVTAFLREILDQEHNGKAIARLLAERLAKDALHGKLGHLKEVLDRTEGAAKQTVEVQGGVGCILAVVPPEGASPEEIARISRAAQERAGPDQTVMVGRCWLDA